MRPYADKEKYPVPGLILLDIKLPGIDGIDVLKTIKEDPESEKDSCDYADDLGTGRGHCPIL